MTPRTHRAAPWLVVLLAACETGPAPVTPAPSTTADACAERAADITAAAQAEARCTQNADCGIRPVPICAIEGVGCNRHTTNLTASREALDAAIRAYTQAPCTLTKCECPAPPTAFSCVDGRCTAGP